MIEQASATAPSIANALEQVRQNPRDHRAYQHLSAAYAKDRQADDLALAAALQAIALEPKAPEAYVQAAAVYGHWNKPERSKEILLRRAPGLNNPCFYSMPNLFGDHELMRARSLQ